MPRSRVGSWSRGRVAARGGSAQSIRHVAQSGFKSESHANYLNSRGGSCPTLVRRNPGRSPVAFGRSPTLARSRPILARSRSDLARCRPRHRPHVDQIGFEIEFGTEADFGQCSSKFAQNWPRIGEIRPRLALIRAHLARCRPKFAPNRRRDCPKIDLDSTTTRVARSRPKLTRKRPNQARSRPMLFRIRQKLGHPGERFQSWRTL